MSEIELPPGWTAHKAPTGHTYYYHAASKKSTYTKPELPAVLSTPPVSDHQTLTLETQDGISKDEDNKDPSLNGDNNDDPADGRKQVAPSTAAEEAVYKDRPKYKSVIPGAEDWLRVQTKQGYHFYHNIVTLESLWEAPQSITKALADWNDDESEDGDTEERGYDDQSQDLSNDEEREYLEAVEPEHDLADQQVVTEEYGEEDIALQLAAMQETEEDFLYAEADDHGPELTIEQKEDIFREMLSDYAVDPFRTWDTQLEKFASDPRYLIFDTTTQRKHVFERYCTEKAQEISREKAATTQDDPRVTFLKFLSSHVKPGQYFVDFKRKYKKEQAYKAFGNSDNEREKLFRSFQGQNKLPRAEKERNFLQLVASGQETLEDDVRFHVLSSDQSTALLATHRASRS